MQSFYWKAAFSWDKDRSGDVKLSLPNLLNGMHARSPFGTLTVAEKQKSYVAFVGENDNVRDCF